MSRSSFRTRFAGLALAGLAVTAPAAAQTTLRTIITTDLRNVMPGSSPDDNHGYVMQQVYEGLVASKADGTPAPMLAAKVEPSKDGLSYTFTLRDGLKFHNGAPVTSKEVVWTWRNFLDPATPWPCRANFDGSRALKVESVEALDDKRVVFKLARPYGAFLSMMARPDCDGTGIAHPDSVVNGAWTRPIGTGPFKWAEWKRGEFIELERFADYKPRSEPADGLAGGKVAKIDRVRFLIVGDPSAARAAALAGNVDLWSAIDPKFAREMAGTGKVKVVGSPIASINTIVMQTNDALLKDKRIRQAINAAIDPAGLVEAVAEGHAVPTSSPIPVSSRYYGAVQKQGQARNIPLARKLLVEAGYRGQAIKITTNSRFAAMQDVAVVAQAQAREAGINLEVEVVEFAAQLDRYLKGNYQMMVFNYAPQLDPLFVLDRFTGDKAKQSDRVWSNPQASELLQQLAQATTPAQRQPLFDQLHRLFVEDATMVVWCSPTSLSAVTPRLKGYEPWAGRKPRLWGVEFGK